MPIYEFECEKCHHTFEKVKKLMSAGSNVTLKVPAGYGGGASCAPSG